MKSLKIGIKFENDAIKSDATDGVVFFAGQQVKGDVVLDCPGRPFALNKICLVVHGRTKVSFDIFHTHHNAHVVHLHEQVPVWVGGKEGTIKLFPAGEYRFPFQFILGANCPPNFKGTQGNIRYHFTVRVEEKTKLGWLPNWLCWSRRRILIQPFGISQRPSPLEFTTTISEQIEHPLANGELVKAKITLGRDKFEQSERIPLKIAFDCAQQLIKLVHSLHYRIVEYVDYESDKQHHCREKKCLLRDQIDLTTMAHFVDDKNELDLLTKPVPTNGPSILNCALIHKFHVLKVIQSDTIEGHPGCRGQANLPCTLPIRPAHPHPYSQNQCKVILESYGKNAVNKLKEIYAGSTKYNAIYIHCADSIKNAQLAKIMACFDYGRNIDGIVIRKLANNKDTKIFVV